MIRTRVGILAAIIVLALAVGLSRSGGEDRSVQAGAGVAQATLSPKAPRACDLLTARIAGAYLGKLRGEPRKSRGPSGDSCTYLSPSLNRSVSVGVYPAAELEADIRSMTAPRRTRVVGRPAAFNSGLGYLIEMRGRPYYLQVAFQHATHLHANRSRSRRLAQTILVGAPAPTGPFICPIYGKRVV